MAFWFGSLFADIFVLITVSFLCFIGYFKYQFNHWKKHNVPFVEPIIPFGNITDFVLQKISMGVQGKELYKYFKNSGSAFGGIYFFASPQLMPIDPELIKSILTKDFQYFTDRGVFSDENYDPLSAHLFSLGGVKWRNLRTKLTPTFTSGKMKMMFPTLVATGEELRKTMDEMVQKNEPIDIKETLARFTTDIIGSSAFGLECNSLKEPENEFRLYGKRIFEVKTLQDYIRRLFGFSMPQLLKLFKIKVTDPQVHKFYMNLVKDVVQYREKNNVQRKDFMHLLLQLKNDGKLHDDEDKSIVNEQSDHKVGTGLTVEEIAAQCYVFFLAGFETSSTTMTFSLYELVKNPEVQEKLREEVLKTLKENNGDLTYDSIMRMPYMDKVVSETLRKYPPLPILNRICNNDYKVPNSNYVVKKGYRVFLSVMGLHYDPEYYPNPDEFNPERFNEENKSSRHPYTYLPFGEGPRICIGMRFGLMQTKVGLAILLSNYRLSLNPKTPSKLVFDHKSLIVTSKDTILLDATKLVK